MLLFIKKLLFFCIPFLCILALEIIIDPYNFMRCETNENMLELKLNISRKKNSYLYKLIEFDRNPTPVIILGDSRDAAFSPLQFEKLTHERVTNLAGGGGSLKDVIEIFWCISKKHNLKKVFIGISMMTYNGILLRDRVTESIRIKNSLPLYLSSMCTLESTMLILKSKILRKEIDLERPPFNREEFWQYQLDLSARYYSTYTYPRNYYYELEKISKYCRDNNICLVFCISPTHVDLQKKINEFSLTEKCEKFKLDLVSFGDVYDFDWENDLTNNKNNFGDPFHGRDSIPLIVVNEMALNKPKYSRYYKCNQK